MLGALVTTLLDITTYNISLRKGNHMSALKEVRTQEKVDEKQEKKPYRSPQLYVPGNLRDLTLGGTGISEESDGGGATIYAFDNNP
ncbi:MAG: hypothetical protein ACP5GX_00400 [Anaerolineae bacterium]